MVAAFLSRKSCHYGWLCEVSDDGEMREVPVAVAVFPMPVAAVGVSARLERT